VAVQTRPRGVALLVASPPRAFAMTILAGGAISLQAYLNGQLGGEAGSATIAAAINNLVAFVATLLIAVASRAIARGRASAVARPAARVALPRRARRRRAGAGVGDCRAGSSAWRC
jgi:Putative inner membrane exporter, YdcZ